MLYMEFPFHVKNSRSPHSFSCHMLAHIIRNLSIHVRANTYNNHTAQPLAILRVYVCQKNIKHARGPLYTFISHCVRWFSFIANILNFKHSHKN